MSHLYTLQNIKQIISVTKFNCKDSIQSIPNPTLKKKVLGQYKQVEIFRIVYKVKSLKVIGYIAIPKSGENLPCIIHLRGGSKDFGMITSKAILGNMLNYSSEGYVVITTQYPGVEGGDGKDEMGGNHDIESIKLLREILKKIPQADSGNLGIKGHSRGGLMVYMLLREVKWIKAAVIAGAPTDQVNRTGDRPGWKEHQKEMWGGSKMETIKRSPIRWVNELSKKAPLLIMHGSADWRVLPRHSLEILPLLAQATIPHRFILFEGADHGISEYRLEYHRQTMDWFNRFLINKEHKGCN
ncbi:MAG: prolyl oligopeptidase family serine peptidase [Patescibacteria group bacterium]